MPSTIPTSSPSVPGSDRSHALKTVATVLTAWLRVAHWDPTGLLAAATVFVTATIISWIGWLPLSWPARLVGTFVPPGDCTGLTPGTRMMYLCSATVALRTLAGPFAVMVLLFVLRKPIAKMVGHLSARLPAESRFLLSPIAATVLFTLSWAAIHYEIADDVGLVSQKTFPGIIGLFTFVTGRYGPLLQWLLRPLFDVRDRVRPFLRVVLAFFIPLLVSLVITFQDRVTATALKEQSIVLLALGLGYLALAPRQGSSLSGARPRAAAPVK